MTRVQATPTATATIHAANTIPFACLQRSARSFSHATDPAESPRRTTVAARLVGTICFCPVPPATINSCCFFCSFRSIHFCRSRGSIPKSSTFGGSVSTIGAGGVGTRFLLFPILCIARFRRLRPGAAAGLFFVGWWGDVGKIRTLVNPFPANNCSCCCCD